MRTVVVLNASVILKVITFLFFMPASDGETCGKFIFRANPHVFTNTIKYGMGLMCFV